MNYRYGPVHRIGPLLFAAAILALIGCKRESSEAGESDQEMASPALGAFDVNSSSIEVVPLEGAGTAMLMGFQRSRHDEPGLLFIDFEKGELIEAIQPSRDEGMNYAAMARLRFLQSTPWPAPRRWCRQTAPTRSSSSTAARTSSPTASI